MTNKVGALILAAGFSHRFGSVKLDAKLNNGETVFAQTLRRVGAAIPNYKVVTRPELMELLRPTESQLNAYDRAEEGMGASLAYGISLVSEWQACLVCLADMPFIEVATYRQLAESLQQDNIVIPFHGEQAGNPVGFGRKFYSDLSRLKGDAGGRAVVKANPEAVISINTEDAAILYDIDTPADLDKYQSR
jgi:molybdenum cofactor cytidylyltransferase